MLNNTLELGTGNGYSKISIQGQKSTFINDADNKKSLMCSTEVTKQGTQRTVAKIVSSTTTTRYANNGDSITGRAPISVAVTVSYPKSQDSETDIVAIKDELKALLIDDATMSLLINGHA